MSSTGDDYLGNKGGTPSSCPAARNWSFLLFELSLYFEFWFCVAQIEMIILKASVN